ncbi:23S rRNA (adenine(2030)-N(6))-methyltransferase RlmJ [Thiomicrorhabdus aquaedulcis]|uniref:23S rRNA (adenine(2030)-N(6))-methyltransferase RlmJ n=1 Tax=Thiomicrorhabdus aquaedulcis TaxID=2211106 RepID=UPI000FD7D55E|nr:23S rRNA (adenine(2030)-N(6))-methyltransferase RlmJ [Thiomicrorhabdus aquaedulcis]
MLSYLHSFHAGNFADVLKHLCLVHTLDYLTQKPAPIFYMDTHSGPGSFKLDQQEAQKNREYENGIAPLMTLQTALQAQGTQLPEAVQRYLEVVQEFNRLNGATDSLAFYPGSPWIASHVLREDDRLSLCELHPREQTTLTQNVKGDRRIKVFNQDGFQTAIGAMPPRERRGLVLIDPPYEVKTDYDRVVEVLHACHKRFATGTYALWYPVVNRGQINQLVKKLKASGVRNIQLFELGLQADTTERGMTSSGMIFINPPWTLWNTLQTTLPFLAQHLGGKNGVYRLEQLAAE